METFCFDNKSKIWGNLGFFLKLLESKSIYFQAAKTSKLLKIKAVIKKSDSFQIVAWERRKILQTVFFSYK